MQLLHNPQLLGDKNKHALEDQSANNISLILPSPPECDVSVSKLLGFETFQFFLDNIGFSIEKVWLQKKYRIRY